MTAVIVLLALAAFILIGVAITKRRRDRWTAADVQSFLDDEDRAAEELGYFHNGHR